MVIEAVMYVCGGFLIATLFGLALFPAIHDRAVRLTHRAIDQCTPASILEMRAEIDGLRAQFATSMCRLERTVQQLKFTSAMQLDEIQQKTRTIKQLKAELARTTAATDESTRPVNGLVPELPDVIDQREIEFKRNKPARRPAQIQSAPSPTLPMDGEPAPETPPKGNVARLISQTAEAAFDEPVLPLAKVSSAVAGNLRDKHHGIELPRGMIQTHQLIGAKSRSFEKRPRPSGDLKKSLVQRGQRLNQCDVEINALVGELVALNAAKRLTP